MAAREDNAQRELLALLSKEPIHDRANPFSGCLVRMHDAGHKRPFDLRAPAR